MRIQWPMGITVLLTAMVAGGGSVASGWDMGRLARFAARQDLRDEVCVAMADGVVTPQEKSELLGDAKKILSAEELTAFQRFMDRLCPPKKTAKHSKNARMQTVKRTPAPSKKSQAAPPAEASSSPVIPTSALLPDRMVPGTRTR